MADRGAGKQGEALYVGASLATMAGEGYGLIEDGALIVSGGRISFVGPRAQVPDDFIGETHDLGGGTVLPGLVDCHTHLVFGGSRSHEFEMRLNGASYEEIAAAGGGIRSTVAATREAGLEDLVEVSAPRLEALMAEGVTTVEIKSGYGLNTGTERKMLKAARALGERPGIDVVTSFLGAHATPHEYEGREDNYIDLVAGEMLPELAAEDLVDCVDAFCEKIAFSKTQVARVFDKAQELGLPIKLHAEQLSHMGGAQMAAERGALSADHLEYLHGHGIKEMAKSGTVAVLLPGAFYTLRETKYPPIHGFRKAGVPMALASDLNPGSSPIASLLAILNMACTIFMMTPQEAIAGVTRNGAKALGLGDDRGTLETGRRADFTHWDIGSPTELCYWMGLKKPVMVWKDGKPVSQG
jgi:imidazolonepropionase